MSATNKSDSSSNRPVIRGSDGDLVSLTQLGRYQIQRKLGSGGMGAVYLALDKNLNRLVALKILPPDKAENPILLKRFEAEAQAAAQLTHDNIVRVYESGEAEGLHYIAMEYVEGTDVQRLIKKRNRIPIRRSTEIIKQVALALDHAASASIVHRDIKPSNLLITQAGVVKLTDLGLARVIDDSEETSITRAGTTVGTVDYMSPEQARSSKAADIRSDLYSLGCTWYHMVTGSPPYPEGSVTNKLHAHATAPIPDPRNLNDTVPEAVVSVIHRLMEKKPIDRYQSVEELLVDLDAVKSTKREVKAEDLAALATAEDEIDEDAEDTSEAPARSTVARRRVEAEEDQDEIPARRSRKSQSTEEPEESNRPRKSRPQKPQSSGSSSPIDALPPREKRKLEDVEGKEASSFNIEILKYILLGVALLAFVGIVGYAISYFASEDSKVGNQQIDLAQRAEEIQAEREANSSQDPNAVQSPNTVHQPPNPSPNNTVKAASGSKIDVDQDLNDAVLNQLPVVKIVSRNVKVDEKSAHTPVEALEKNDAAELIIEFDLDRPFVWEQPISIEGRNLFLRSAPEKPARILVNTAGAMVDGLIKGKNAQIVVNGLHFGILAYDVPGKNDLSLFRMIDSDLRVENSTFTIEETRDHPIQLCHAQTSPGNSQNQQWKNCLIRGQDWAPLQIATDRLKLRVEGVAAFLGGNPFLDLGLATGNSGGRPGSSRPIQDVDRDLAFSDLVVVNRGTQVTITNLNSRIDPPQTQFRLNRCTFVSQGAATVPFLMISNWPENVLAQESEGQLSRLRWVTENSSFCGWKTRSVATTNKTRASFTVENDDQWKTFWGNVGLFGNWDDKTLNPLSATQLVSFTGNELQRMGLTAVSRPEEITLSAMENLPVPPLTRQSWRAELAAQQKFPSPVASPFNKSTPRVSVNLNDPKVDLGQYLSSTNLPDPVVVEVKGFGLRTSDRIRLENRRVKLEFQSEPNKFPLTLRPKLTSTGNQSGPWISVTGGYLEISSGVFNVDPVVDSAMPSQWVKSQGASVLLNQCYVTAAEQPQEKLAALIDVDSAPAPTADFSSLSLQQSYLQYGGDLLRINLKSCRPFVNQSVLVTQRHALALSYKGEGAAKRGFFQLTHSTLSSRAGHFQFEIPQPEPHRPPLVEGVIRDNVFTGAVGIEDKSAPRSQLLAAKPSLDDLPGRVWWWGERNGFSNELTQNLQNKPLSDQWTTYWGRGHVQEPLFGADGVMLADNLSQLKQLRPSSFRLFREARARTWGPNQTLIGADCEKLDLAEYDATKATPPNTNPNQNQPKPVVPKI